MRNNPPPRTVGSIEEQLGPWGWVGQRMPGAQLAGPVPAQSCCCLKLGLRPQFSSVEASCA